MGNQLLIDLSELSAVLHQNGLTYESELVNKLITKGCVKLGLSDADIEVKHALVRLGVFCYAGNTYNTFYLETWKVKNA